MKTSECSTASARDASRESSADRARVFPAVLNMFFCAERRAGAQQTGSKSIGVIFGFHWGEIGRMQKKWKLL